ncbi:MAG: hypothetical protein ABIK73_08640 [candidate division WOR-3 bacterium]
MTVKTMLKTTAVVVSDLLQIIEKVYTNCENCGKTEKLAEMVFWQKKILCTKCFRDELYTLGLKNNEK